MSFPEWIVAHGDTLQFGLVFGLLGFLAAIEPLVPRRTGPMDRKVRWPTNVLFTFLNLIALGMLPVTIIGTAFWAAQHRWGLLNQIAAPIPAIIAVTLLVRAFISFFTHYMMHMVPAFWRLHRVHHLDTELDVTTTVRVHPIEFFVQSLLAVPLVLAFGLTPWVLVSYEVFDVIVTLWSHSNTRLPLAIDRVLRYVVVTPDLHRIHHSAWKPETNSNFGAVFPLWDIVFGTFRDTPRGGHEHMRLGLDDVRGRDAQRPLWLLGSIVRNRLTPAVDAPARWSSARTEAVRR